MSTKLHSTGFWYPDGFIFRKKNRNLKDDILNFYYDFCIRFFPVGIFISLGFVHCQSFMSVSCLIPEFYDKFYIQRI